MLDNVMQCHASDCIFLKELLGTAMEYYYVPYTPSTMQNEILLHVIFQIKYVVWKTQNFILVSMLLRELQDSLHTKTVL